MAFSPLQQSFAGGEISPRFRGLVGAELYKVALAEALNWEVLPGGAMRKRGPTRYVANLISGGSRLIPFKLASGDDYVLELGNLVGRIYTTAGRSSGSGAAATNLVTNGDFTLTTGWTLYRGSISSGRLRLSVGHTFDPELKIYEDDPGNATENITVPPGGGTYLVTWDQSGTCGASLRIGAILLATPQLVALTEGVHALTIETAGAYSEYVLVDNVRVEDAAAGSSFEIVTPWTLAQLPAVQWVAETGQDRLILVHGDVAPFYIRRDSDGAWWSGTFTFAAAGAGKPPEWTAGPPAYWPSTVEIHAGRLWAGRGNRLWASRVGALDDFRRYTIISTGLPSDTFTNGTTQVTAECGLDLQVSTKAAGMWLQGQRNLLLGTDQGEHYAAGSGGGPIAAGDVDVVLGSEFGSAPIQAVAAGDQVLYVSADRRRPRVIGWELSTEGWVSRDLAWYAEHITKARITQAYFAKHPYPAALFILGDGTVAVCCYSRAAQQLAWWRFEVGGGTVLSACVTDGSYGSIVWMSVLRGATACLEYVKLDDDGEVLLDGQVTQEVPANLTLTGLAHLEGEAVQVVIGRVVIDATVTGGQVVLSADVAAQGDVATVGVPYTARAKTLPLEGGQPRGSAQASRRRFAKVRLRLNDSALPAVNGYRPPERHPATPTDTGEPAFTGDVDVPSLGWEADGQITIEQDLPLRTEVLAIFGSAQVNEI